MRGKIDARDTVLLGALLIFVAGLCLQPMSESDLFFRLKVGQEILARRGLAGRNLFSFTAPDHADLDPAWAFEVACALLYRVGGFRALVIGKTLWIGSVFGAAFLVCRRRGAGPISAALALGVAAIVMRERFVERPHIVSFAGEVVVLGALARLDRPLTARGVATFALAMVIWANAHAGLFVAVVLLMLAGLGARGAERVAGRRAFILAAIASGAAFATPIGARGLLRYLVLHLTLPGLHPVDEFRTATWRSDALFFLWVLGVAALVAVVALRGRRHTAGPENEARPSLPCGSPGSLPTPLPTSSPNLWPELLPGLAMILLGIATVRFAADAVLVTAPLLATRWSALVGIVHGGRSRRGLRLERAAVPAAALALVVAAVWPRLADARAGRPVLDLDIDTDSLQLPLAAIRFVEQNGLRERMYNDFEIGSYLIFEGYPRYRVFVDPRLPAYPDDMHRLLGSFDLDRATWDAAMTRYGVESALLAYAGINRRVAWWDPEIWALVYRAGDARVFVRRRDRWRALIAANEIPATFSFTVEEGTTTWPIEKQPGSSPVSNCEWERRLGDLLFDIDQGAFGRSRPHYERALKVPGCLAASEEIKLAAWLGAVDLGEKKYGEAATRLGRALTLSPGDTRTRANRAAAFEGDGRRVEAAADWAQVAEEARGTPLGEAAAGRARRLGGQPER